MIGVRYCVNGVEMKWFFYDFWVYANCAGFALVEALG